MVTVCTLALDRVKDETTRTCDRVGMAVHTEVELVANLPEEKLFSYLMSMNSLHETIYSSYMKMQVYRFVRVSKITMLTRTTLKCEC